MAKLKGTPAQPTIKSKPSSAPKINPARGASTKAPAAVAKSSGQVVKFSDKLTDSLEDITGMINKHKDMIDSIQEVSLDLTELIGNLHTWALKYAGIVNQVLDNLLPIIEKLPIVPEKVTKLLKDIEGYTQKLLDTQEATSKTIADVQNGLKTGDVERIKNQSGELKKAAESISKMLPK